GRILWFNARAAKLWGRAPRLGDDGEKFCGSYQLDFDGRPISREECPMAAVLRTGRAIGGVEAKLERPNGSSIWAMVHIEPIEDEDGRIVGAINCFHETTDLHRVFDQRQAATYDHAGIGIAEVDAEARLMRANMQLAALFACAPEQLLGRSIFDPCLAEEIEEDRAQFARQVAGEIERYSVEKRFRRMDGTVLWAAVTSASVRDGEGRFL